MTKICTQCGKKYQAPHEVFNMCDKCFGEYCLMPKEQLGETYCRAIRMPKKYWHFYMSAKKNWSNVIT